MELALKQFQTASDAEKDWRKKAQADLEIYTGQEQWEKGTRAQRDIDNRPCLVINKLPGAVRQITNQMRQNMPMIRTIPVNDSSEEVADIFDGMMRHIQESSQAGIAYSTAFNHQVICGQGFFRIVADYVDENSFDQEIKIERIKNALSIYVDPARS